MNVGDVVKVKTKFMVQSSVWLLSMGWMDILSRLRAIHAGS